MQVGRALAYSRRLLKKYGLTGWRVQVNSRFFFCHGSCQHDEKLIELGQLVVETNDWPIIKDIVLHEIAHALCPQKENHGVMWRMVASLIGVKNVEATYEDKHFSREYRHALTKRKRNVKRTKRAS